MTKDCFYLLLTLNYIPRCTDVNKQYSLLVFPTENYIPGNTENGREFIRTIIKKP